MIRLLQRIAIRCQLIAVETDIDEVRELMQATGDPVAEHFLGVEHQRLVERHGALTFRLRELQEREPSFDAADRVIAIIFAGVLLAFFIGAL